MCGIVGYVGQKQALEIVVAGLRRLEYRGYDSAGVAVISDGMLEVRKKAGKLANLETLLGSDPLPDSTTGIGHTRWATHGGPTDSNAHPHVSEDGRVAVIHNGIIENFAELRDELDRGRRPPGLRDRHRGRRPPARRGAARWPDDDLAEAMRASAAGSRAPSRSLAVDREQPDLVVGARRNSPLVVGVGEGENFLASDVAAFVDHTREALELGQDQVVTITPDTVDDHRLRRRSPSRSSVHGRLGRVRRGEGRLRHCSCSRRSPSSRRPSPTPCAGGSARTRDSSSTRCTSTRPILREINKVVVIACGTAANAGMVAKYAIEHWTRLPVEVELASEFRYRDPIVGPDSLVIAISQSGRDDGHADGACATRRRRARRTLAICNTVGSTIPRESDAVLYTYAGPGDRGRLAPRPSSRRSSLPTSSGLYLAQVRGKMFEDEIRSVLDELRRHAEQGRPRARHHRAGAGAGARVRGLVRRCSSSAGTSASRSRSRARSSSRSSPTCTPRASPRAS